MGWRKLHNEELYGMFSSSNSTRMTQSRILRWARHVTRMGRGEMHTEFWGKNEGKRPLGVPRNRGHNDNKMYLEEVG